MARPGYRSRRSREEEEEEEDDRSSRRGGRSGPKKPSGPPPMVLIGGAVVVVLAVGIGIAAGGGKKEPPKPPPVVLAPVKKVEPTPVIAPPPVKPPPKPLTPEERAWIDGLFKKAEPHVVLFRQKAKEGWDCKKNDDMEGANAAWVIAKKECHAALNIVNEALEDFDKFSGERQEAHMRGFNAKAQAWQNEMAAIPKVDVDR